MTCTNGDECITNVLTQSHVKSCVIYPVFFGWKHSLPALRWPLIQTWEKRNRLPLQGFWNKSILISFGLISLVLCSCSGPRIKKMFWNITLVNSVYKFQWMWMGMVVANFAIIAITGPTLLMNIFHVKLPTTFLPSEDMPRANWSVLIFGDWQLTCLVTQIIWIDSCLVIQWWCGFCRIHGRITCIQLGHRRVFHFVLWK